MTLGIQIIAKSIYLDGGTPVVYESADSGGGEEGGDSGSPRADSLGQSALRRQLYLQLAAQKLTLELFVLADVRGDHTLHLALVQ